MNSSVAQLRQVITAEQIQKRVKELGRQISDDYKGLTIQMLAVLENAFMFQADLVRALKSQQDLAAQFREFSIAIYDGIKKPRVKPLPCVTLQMQGPQQVRNRC